ncbi:hypothetical protein L1887_06030 [Cichorium endivia]|nr:hypothetical protein L1887_06030 [Cichorium endivia]
MNKLPHSQAQTNHGCCYFGQRWWHYDGILGVYFDVYWFSVCKAQAAAPALIFPLENPPRRFSNGMNAADFLSLVSLKICFMWFVNSSSVCKAQAAAPALIFPLENPPRRFSNGMNAADFLSLVSLKICFMWFVNSSSFCKAQAAAPALIFPLENPPRRFSNGMNAADFLSIKESFSVFQVISFLL